jgi:hypothetical protein
MSVKAWRLAKNAFGKYLCFLEDHRSFLVFFFKDVMLTTRTFENKTVWIPSLCLVSFFAYSFFSVPHSKRGKVHSLLCPSKLSLPFTRTGLCSQSRAVLWMFQSLQLNYWSSDIRQIERVIKWSSQCKYHHHRQDMGPHYINIINIKPCGTR